MIEEEDIELIELVEFVNQSDSIDIETSNSIEDIVRSTLGDELPESLNFGVRLTKYTRTWDDVITPKFIQGELVVPYYFDEETEEEVIALKVLGCDKMPNTYCVKRSNSDITFVVHESAIKKAPEDAKWEKVKYDPFSIPGFKVSCPSNTKYKK